MELRVEKNSRLVALPELVAIIDAQGRRRIWMGEQIGIGSSHVARVLTGERTVSVLQGERWAQILGVPLFLLWKLSGESANEQEAA